MQQLKPNQIDAWPVLRWSEAASLFKKLIHSNDMHQEKYLSLFTAILSKRLATKMLELIIPMR